MNSSLHSGDILERTEPAHDEVLVPDAEVVIEWVGETMANALGDGWAGQK